MSKTPLALACITILVIATAATAAPKKTAYDAPALSCAVETPSSISIQVCAGATGAPAGFSLQWLPAAQLALGPDGLPGTADDNTWPDSSLMCAASFSGNANASTFDLGPYACITVQVGDVLFDQQGASSNCASMPLDCGTEYAFRAFAHATSVLKRSAFTANHFCETSSCTTDDGCTYTQGYWKNHGPAASGNNLNEWPVASLALGQITYTELELQSIFDQPAQGNGLISLAHQLIAAKLNVANGADDTAIADAIADADALIGFLVVPPVGTDSLSPSLTSALNAALTNFNEGATGPGHCD